MTGLTLFTPVRRRWHWFLWTGLKVTRHLPFMGRHILQFNFIKFVRWTVVPHLDGERLKQPYLFFESNFDGPWQHYIDAFAYVIPLDIRQRYDLTPGTQVEFVDEGGAIRLVVRRRVAPSDPAAGYGLVRAKAPQQGSTRRLSEFDPASLLKRGK